MDSSYCRSQWRWVCVYIVVCAHYTMVIFNNCVVYSVTMRLLWEHLCSVLQTGLKRAAYSSTGTM